MSISARIRALSPTDDMTALTKLIRAAYAERAANNLRYWATHQSVEDTVSRYAMGQGLIAESNGQIVGTLTVRPPQADSQVAAFRQPAAWTLAQFGVLPEFRGRGVGRQLHDAALAHAQANGGRIIALDTAAPAVELIEMYHRWGYRIVGECDWRPHTNYLSVVMAKQIAPDRAAEVSR